MSLRADVRRRILDDVLGSVDGEWKVLVVDAAAVALLATCCKNSDVMERRVTLIESLAVKRQPLPMYPAIYLLSPEESSVDGVINDWKDAPPKPYLSAHLFFTSQLRDDLLDKIGQSNLAKHLQSLREIYLDFHCVESQAFSLKMKDDLSLLFGPQKALAKCADGIADRLLTVCITMNENPYIRHQNSEVASTIAKALQQRLDSYMALNPKFKEGVSANRATFLVVDRTLDMLAPFLHEFTYQAMLYDVVAGLHEQGGRYTHSFTNSAGHKVDREALLDESDPLWLGYRHRHVSEVLLDVQKSIEGLAKANKSVVDLQTKGKDDLDIHNISQAVRQMPRYQDRLNKLSLHTDIAEKLMRIFREEALMTVANCEQLLATDEYPNGDKLGEKDGRKELERLLKDPSVKPALKFRVLLLYVVSQGGLKEKERQELLSMGGFGEREATAVTRHLALFGVSVDRPKKEKAGWFAISKDKAAKKKKRVGDVASGPEVYDLSRYIPALKGVVDAELSGRLSTAEFPYTKDGPLHATATAASSSSSSTTHSLRAPRSPQPLMGLPSSSSSSSSSSSGLKPGQESAFEGVACVGPRLVVFVAGGVAYSELRVAYELLRECRRDVVVGATEVLTPAALVNFLLQPT